MIMIEIIGVDASSRKDETRALIIHTDGTIEAIYNEVELTSLINEVVFKKIRRASHVEPTDNGEWTADMSPVGGPVLGPYGTRKQALEEEVFWLTKAMIEGSLNVHFIE